MEEIIKWFTNADLTDIALAISTVIGAFAMLAGGLRMLAKGLGFFARMTANEFDDGVVAAIGKAAEGIASVTDKAAQLLKWVGLHVGSDPVVKK